MYYSLFSSSCLGRYWYFLLAGKKGQKAPASSEINASTALSDSLK